MAPAATPEVSAKTRRGKVGSKIFRMGADVKAYFNVANAAYYAASNIKAPFDRKISVKSAATLA